MVHQKIAKKSFVDSSLDFIMSIDRKVAMVFVVVFCVSISFFGYNLWLRSYNASMQAHFAPLLAKYNKAMAENKDLDLLQKQFEQGIEAYSRSSHALYYKSYIVSLLLKQNKTDEAYQLLSDIIVHGKNSPLVDAYVIKRAVIDLDSQDSARQQEGETVLKNIGLSTSAYFDEALFYLGRYYWAHDKIDQAREMWQKLVSSFVDQRVGISPWVEQAQEYLNIMIV